LRWVRACGVLRGEYAIQENEHFIHCRTRGQNCTLRENVKFQTVQTIKQSKQFEQAKQSNQSQQSKQSKQSRDIAQSASPAQLAQAPPSCALDGAGCFDYVDG
jgi:hypothetical protein